MKNILVTSISSKTALIYCLRDNINSLSNEIKIYGIDSKNDCLAKYIVDSFHQVSELENLIIEDFINKCIRWSILLIIPTRDEDVLFFSKNYLVFEQAGIFVMSPNFESVINCLDKYLFYKNTKQFNTIPTSNIIDNLKSKRFVVKERFGAGSKKMGINLTKSKAIQFSKKITNPIFQPFITGTEISVDAYVNRKGEVMGVVLRERNLIINGEAKVSTTFSDNRIEIISIEIIKHLNLFGHVMLQMFKTPHNELFLIECNPRFGGASTLSVKAGLDSFKWAYLEAMKVDISNYVPLICDYPITQIRIPTNMYL